MLSNQYAMVAAVIFTIVAVLQLARAIYGWPVIIGTTEIPVLRVGWRLRLLACWRLQASWLDDDGKREQLVLRARAVHRVTKVLGKASQAARQVDRCCSTVLGLVLPACVREHFPKRNPVVHLDARLAVSAEVGAHVAARGSGLLLLDHLANALRALHRRPHLGGVAITPCSPDVQGDPFSRGHCFPAAVRMRASAVRHAPFDSLRAMPSRELIPSSRGTDWQQ